VTLNISGILMMMFFVLLCMCKDVITIQVSFIVMINHSVSFIVMICHLSVVHSYA
jgi:hypothetical protein